MKKTAILFWAGVAVLGFLALGTAQIISVPQGFSAVRTFPNPWRSDQNAMVPLTWDGLPPGAVTSLRIFTIAGEQVRTLSGTGSIQWDMRNDAGENVASGVYLYLLDSQGQRHSGKVAVIR